MVKLESGLYIACFGLYSFCMKSIDCGTWLLSAWEFEGEGEGECWLANAGVQSLI